MNVQNEDFLAEFWLLIIIQRAPRILTFVRQLCHYVKRPVGVSSPLNLSPVAVRRAEEALLHFTCSVCVERTQVSTQNLFVYS